jgi:hypothetical protein
MVLQFLARLQLLAQERENDGVWGIFSAKVRRCQQLPSALVG